MTLVERFAAAIQTPDGRAAFLGRSLRGADGLTGGESGGELHADGDPHRVEPCADRAGRESSQILWNGVAHDELTELDRPSEMNE